MKIYPNHRMTTTSLTNQEQFSTPVALFLFKRVDKPLKIIERLSKIRPTTVYLLSDGGRTKQEQSRVDECRKAIEEAIKWNCRVIKRYQDINIGVHENIAGGAKWVLSQEKWAIFLEDDNLPEITFFRFCEELLIKYQYDNRVLWICGTNYLKEYNPEDGSSYVFTKNMLPCGWASWSSKFSQFYDHSLALWANKRIRNRIKHEYLYKKLYDQDAYNLDYELDTKETTGRFYSWDYHMAFSMRVHNVCAIVPKYNQIRNIGADYDSTHGGVSLGDAMTERFCDLPTKPLEFPLTHPDCMLLDLDFEKRTAKIILDPKFFTLRAIFSRATRLAFRIRKNQSIKSFFIDKVRFTKP